MIVRVFVLVVMLVGIAFGRPGDQFGKGQVLPGFRALKSPQVATFRGKLRYQVCTESTCFIKEKVVEWQFRVKPLDRQRVPAERLLMK